MGSVVIVGPWATFFSHWHFVLGLAPGAPRVHACPGCSLYKAADGPSSGVQCPGKGSHKEDEN